MRLDFERYPLMNYLILEEELLLSKDESEDGSLVKLNVVYEELYKKFSSDRDSEYAPSLEGSQKK
jgi:hypothetical protein